jgi:GNAT superfamily N-acetyltransferase/predicted ester cyclase
MLSSRSVAVSYYNALNRNDAGAASLLFHREAKVDVPGATLVGPTEFKQWMQMFFDAFPDIAHEHSDLSQDGDSIAVDVVVTGTHTAPLASAEGEIPPTFKRITLHSSNIFQVDAGRIRLMEIKFDQANLMRQLGLAMNASSGPALQIENATEKDAALLLKLIKGLADYERLSDKVTATEDMIRESLFGPQRAAEAVIGYVDGIPAGFALFFHNFSTFLGQRGLYLEDLFVLPEWRGRGFGRDLLQHLAKIAVERNCGRMEWSVLNWNEPAIGFYRRLGARPMDEWTVFRLTGDQLQHLAGTGPQTS